MNVIKWIFWKINFADDFFMLTEMPVYVIRVEDLHIQNTCDWLSVFKLEKYILF